MKNETKKRFIKVKTKTSFKKRNKRKYKITIKTNILLLLTTIKLISLSSPFTCLFIVPIFIGEIFLSPQLLQSYFYLSIPLTNTSDLSMPVQTSVMRCS